MQLIFASAALVATAAASTLTGNDGGFTASKPYTKIVNRCSYPVYLWSVDKELGCPASSALQLDQGDRYMENYRKGTNGGISIKLSKTDTCGGKDITQLEYKISDNPAGNFLDMSFVDCLNNLEDCPGRTDGFYLKSGNTPGSIHVSAVNNEHCPIMNVYNAEDAAKVSYILPDDPQTKFCGQDEPLELYLCGGEAPESDDGDESDESTPSSSAAPSSSAEAPSSSAPSSTSAEEPASSTPAPTSSADADLIVAAAAVTPAPSSASPPPVVKTEVVYVTEYVNKRHAHARRHQHFHA